MSFKILIIFALEIKKFQLFFDMFIIRKFMDTNQKINRSRIAICIVIKFIIKIIYSLKMC